MLLRLIWNPDWNETLFMVSCAERIEQNPTEHCIAEIRDRVRIAAITVDAAGADLLACRLIFVQREGIELTEEITFVSDPFSPDSDAE